MKQRKLLNSPDVSIWLVAVVAAINLMACKPGIPGKYIQPDEMEQILYEYHMADVIYKTPGNGYQGPEMLSFKVAILKEHGYTEAEFDSSMVYYMRHTEQLRQVYEHIADRLSKEALAMGASVSDVNKYDKLTENGDTANIWTGAQAIVLTTDRPFNLSTFSMHADSTFLPGDKFIFEFDSKFHFQDGMRDAEAVLTLHFANDSIAAHHTKINSSNHFSIQMADNKRIGLKKLKGYFILNSENKQSSSALHLLVMENIRLVRMHTPEPVPAPVVPDSTATDSTATDSIVKLHNNIRQ